MITLYTVCSGDHFQHYLPSWVWSARRLWNDIDISCVIRGEVDGDVKAYLEKIGCKVQEGFKEYPNEVSTDACLRFTEECKGDEVLITDVDLVFLEPGLMWFMRARKDQLKNYAAFQGGVRFPERPSIAPDGWNGNMRRLAGGFVLVTPEWYEKTEKQRAYWRGELKAGRWGTFREADEVMLFRICRDSGLALPNSMGMPSEMRGLHLGDFKESMAHRWKNIGRMMHYLPEMNKNIAKDLLADKSFQNMLKIASKNKTVSQVWGNVLTHLNERR